MSARSLSFVQTRRAWVSRRFLDAIRGFAPLRRLFSRVVTHRGRLDHIECVPYDDGRSLMHIGIHFVVSDDERDRWMALPFRDHLVEVPALARAKGGA